MNKEDVLNIYNGILLSHKKEWNWVICSDVDGHRECHTEWSQKEKIKYSIVMNISGIWKNNIDYIICKAEIETQTQRTNVWIPRGKVGGGGLETGWHMWTTETTYKTDR